MKTARRDANTRSRQRRYPTYVYDFAAFLAGRYQRGGLVVLGCDQADALTTVGRSIAVVGVDQSNVVRQLRPFPGCQWIDSSRQVAANHLVSDEILTQSVVVCSGLLERGATAWLWTALRRAAEVAGIVIVCCAADSAPSHICDDEVATEHWFSDLLRSNGLRPALVGRTMNKSGTREPTLIAVVDDRAEPPSAVAPTDFRVTAIVPMFNEVDIIRSTVDRLLDERIEVVIIDNWSTDRSFELVQEVYGSSPAVQLERFPVEGPTSTFSWMAILQRIETIAAQSGTDWAIKNDADEVREGPWAQVGLRDSLYAVQTRGYNRVDHTRLDFRPTESSLTSDEDPMSRLDRFEFKEGISHSNAWRNIGVPVELARHGGHQVTFDGHRLFPYNFLIRHYPLRSQAQANQKVFVDRRARWAAEERDLGWHIQYDKYQQGHSFSWDPDALIQYDGRFAGRYLIERLSRLVSRDT